MELSANDIFSLKIQEFVDAYIARHIEEEEWAAYSLSEEMDEEYAKEMVDKILHLTERVVVLEAELRAHAMSDDDIWELKEDAMELYDEQATSV